MANEIGTTLLNSLTNSTFDIGNMAKAIAESTVAGPKAILEKNELKVNTELNALNYLKSNLTAFQTYLTDLSSPKLFTTKAATSSNDAIVGLSVTGNAVAGSYQVQSLQLAQANTQVANKTFSSLSDTITSGNLSIGVGGQTKTIPIGPSNNTLEGLQKSINNGDYGVNASVINNGGVYQMMFSSKTTGAQSQMTISGISDFDVDGFTTTASAQDAVMSINGLSVASSTNTFSGVIEGLDIQLKSTSLGTTQTLNVAGDSQKVVDTVKSFVDVYNQLDTILDEMGSYKTLTEEEAALEENAFVGDLAGSSLLRNLKEQIKSALSGAIAGLTGNNTLASIGVSSDREGQLTLDETVLNTAATGNLDSLSLLFAKGGVASDPLINVLGGSDRTLAGNYTLDITQMAERATVTAGAFTPAANEYLAASARVLDPQASLSLQAGSAMQVSIDGVTAVAVNFTVGTYATQNDVAAKMQTDINDALTAAATGQSVVVAYDSAQSRFEISTANGTLNLSGITGLNNQGFNVASTAGEALIDLNAGGSFGVSVDGSTSANVNLTAGKYTLSELAQNMQTTINGLNEVSSTGAKVSVSTAGGVLSLSSERFGMSSNIALTGLANMDNAGLTADVSDVGQNVDGTITTALGALSLGAYVDSADGRKVKISDFAAIAGQPAEVRGLQFDVLGGLTGARGNINFTEGFASRMDATIKALLSTDNGLLSSRTDSLSQKVEDYEAKREKLDARYEVMLMKYQMQFSTLQSLLSSNQQTSDFLTATFNSNNN